jgi:hypothetical protein
LNAPTIPHAATILYANGDIDTVALPDDGQARMEKLTELIGGDYIQALPISRVRYMLIDENGKLHTHVRNQAATDLAHEAEAIQPSDYIAGTAVIVLRSAVL